MSLKVCAAITCLVAVLSSSAFAQDATISGIVSDTAQAVMPGVRITVRNVETDSARTVTTNDSGSFTVTSLAPGKYELKAEITGFRSYEKTGIVLEVDQSLRDDITLAVGSVSESVSVT